jgi:hypothetical protein
MYVNATIMISSGRDRYELRKRKSRKEMIKTLKSFVEKFVVITEENAELMDFASAKEDGNARAETTNSPAKADAVSIETEINTCDPTNWSDLL